MDEVIGNDAAAQRVGVTSGTWRAYVKRQRAPQPHRREVVGGHALPVWTEAALDEWQANRPRVPGRPRTRVGRAA